jgi:Glyoxalase-like domain
VPEGKTVKNRLHLDLGTSAAAAETDRLLGLGASVLHVFEENGQHRWTTFADPEGNELSQLRIRATLAPGLRAGPGGKGCCVSAAGPLRGQ